MNHSAVRPTRITYELLLCALIVPTIGCDGYTMLKGHIVDGDGEPISGAQITLTKEGHPVGIEKTSKADGSFSVGGTHEPSPDALDFRVVSKGFREERRRVPPGSDHAMRVVLERERRAAEEKAPGERTEKGQPTQIPQIPDT